MAMRDADTSFEDIGAALTPKLTKERVRQIILNGAPKRPGRPAGPKRRATLRRRLHYWEGQIKSRTEQGLDTRYAKSRVDRISADLATLEEEAPE